ncbi:MAG: hypothetical protein AAB308_13440, partial [Nitrospirota bacterium]
MSSELETTYLLLHRDLHNRRSASVRTLRKNRAFLVLSLPWCRGPLFQAIMKTLTQALSLLGRGK